VSNDVDHVSVAISAMQGEWCLLEALMGGTRAMRAAGTKYLPRWPGETAGSDGIDPYLVRKDQTTLYPAYARTVSVMAGKPFAKQLTLNEEAPPKMVEWCADVDRQGTSLHVFAAEMFEESFYGLAGILVDTPRADNAGRLITQAEQQAAGMRPYMVRVFHRQILGWRARQTSAGLQLLQLRLKEDGEEDDGEYGSKLVERVRVLEPGKWTLLRKSGSAWGEEGSGTTGLKYIPFVPIYGKRVAFMIGKPPLIDLGYQNVEHWQSKSDQQNILHIARVPILTISGLTEAPALILGAQSGVHLGANPDAKIQFVEHTGKAIEAGRQSLIDLEGRMIATGAELLVAKPGQRSAEEASNDAEANKSDLQRMAEVFEDSLNQALSFMAEMGGVDDSTTATLHKGFAARSLSEAVGTLLVEMVRAGLIRKETALKELQRSGMLGSDIDVAAEILLAAEEAEPEPGDEEDDPPPGQ
jgi:hypothetical protein